GAAARLRAISPARSRTRVLSASMSRPLSASPRIAHFGGDDVDFSAGHGCLSACPDLFQRFHDYVRSIFGGRKTSGFAGVSEGARPVVGTGSAITRAIVVP